MDLFLILKEAVNIVSHKRTRIIGVTGVSV